MALVEYIKSPKNTYCLKGKKHEGGSHSGMFYKVKMIGNKEQLLFIEDMAPANSWDDLVKQTKSKVSALEASK